MSDDIEMKPHYRVVVNNEEQYSTWPADRDLPLGWSDGGKAGPKSDCLAHIESIWTGHAPAKPEKEHAGTEIGPGDYRHSRDLTAWT